MSNPIVMRIKRGSTSYYVLNYARFRSRQKDGTFTCQDYNEFRVSRIKPSYITRAVNSLTRLGLLQKMQNDSYKITEKGITCLDEHETTQKELLWKRTKNRRPGAARQQAMEELKEKEGFDF